MPYAIKENFSQKCNYLVWNGCFKYFKRKSLVYYSTALLF